MSQKARPLFPEIVNKLAEVKESLDDAPGARSPTAQYESEDADSSGPRSCPGCTRGAARSASAPRHAHRRSLSELEWARRAGRPAPPRAPPGRWARRPRPPPAPPAPPGAHHAAARRARRAAARAPRARHLRGVKKILEPHPGSASSPTWRRRRAPVARAWTVGRARRRVAAVVARAVARGSLDGAAQRTPSGAELRRRGSCESGIFSVANEELCPARAGRALRVPVLAGGCHRCWWWRPAAPAAPAPPGEYHILAACCCARYEPAATASVYTDSSEDVASLTGSDSLYCEERLPRHVRSLQISKIVEYFERKGAEFTCSRSRTARPRGGRRARLSVCDGAVRSKLPLFDKKS
uniref:Uncharacterized protein n=1 Tax=Heliothis virescens TaxID=7102 RepID=A0A2A4IUL6_HELVI